MLGVFAAKLRIFDKDFIDVRYTLFVAEISNAILGGSRHEGAQYEV